jgi:hypothetical protein
MEMTSKLYLPATLAVILIISNVSFAESVKYPEIIRAKGSESLSDQEVVQQCAEFTTTGVLIKALGDVLGRNVADNLNNLTKRNDGDLLYGISQTVGNKWSDNVYNSVLTASCRMNITFTPKLAKIALNHFAVCNKTPEDKTYQCVLNQFLKDPR